MARKQVPTQTPDNLCPARPPCSLLLLSQQPTNRLHRHRRGEKGGKKKREKEILQVFSKLNSEVPSTGRFLLPVHIVPLYFCLEPCGLAVRSSQTDLLYQGLSSLCPRGRGGCLLLSLATRRERTCGETGREGRRHPHPAAPLAASPTQPRTRSRVGCAGRSVHDRARATRDLPGRAGCPAAGVHAAGLAPGPDGTGGRWQPPPRPLPAASHSGGAAAGASPPGQGGSVPPALLCPPAPRRAAGCPPRPAPLTRADVCSPAFYF